MRSTRNAAWGTGADNAHASMTNYQARSAREFAAWYGLSTRELAPLFGVCHSAMSNLLRGITYQDAGGPIRGKQ